MILASSYYGFPLSTTQITSGAVMGSGLGRCLEAVRWGLAGRMVTAWLVTLPVAALAGLLCVALLVFGIWAMTQKS